MASVTVTVGGADGAEKRLRGLARAVEAERILSGIVDDFKDANAVVTPYVTGNLQRSFTARRLPGNAVLIRWAATYASFVDSYGKSRGFVQRVIDYALRSNQRRLRRALQGPRTAA